MSQCASQFILIVLVYSKISFCFEERSAVITFNIKLVKDKLFPNSGVSGGLSKLLVLRRKYSRSLVKVSLVYLCLYGSSKEV